MDPLLKHMVDLTTHRDHSMLDLSVISAVQELACALRTRLLSIYLLRDQIYVMPKASISQLQPAQIEEHLDPSQDGEPITNYPALAHCIQHNLANAEHMAEDGLRTLWLPIWIKDKANVCLEITNPTPYTSQTTQIISGVVSVYRNFQNLLDYSERDALTGLLNRKTFDDQLAKMIASTGEQENGSAPDGEERRQRHKEEKHWLAVVDVDHFKRVNDQFGHLYGDEVLILVANLLQSSFRSNDRVFRFGGEEFVVLLRSTTYDNARKIIERFRQNVESHAFPQIGQITVSVGFVAVSPYESPVVILGHADQALYYAKTHGRNLVCHYDELVREGELATSASNDTAEFFFD
ncbi:GGDEF domain-containing protein [Massilia sp. W12]|uniref:GGDEF domain-containing protein n=1 Tax=Massilia sp. W12 TaxID=3126507 RepID=UPI0030CCA2FD